MAKAELREWINGCYHFAWQLTQIDALERYYHPNFMGTFNQQESFDLYMTNAVDMQLQITSPHIS